MKDLLFCINVTPKLIYLTLMLVIIGQALYQMLLIPRRYIIWFLMLISMLVYLVLDGFNLPSFGCAIVATSLSGTIYQIIKNIERKIGNIN